MVTYFAVFHKNENNQYEVNFPDLKPYAATYGNTLDEAMQSAHDALTGFLLTQADFHEDVPKPSEDPAIFKVTSPDFIVPVKVNLELEREKEKNKLVKKTLSIPAFLNIEGKKAGINFSELLTAALKRKLGES